jgi:two-component system, OmpR family, sensor histidine kinase QseC
MKLFTRYQRINLMATVLVFVLSGISFYFLLRYVLLGQVDEDLKIEKHEIQTYNNKYHTLPEIIAVRDQQISYTVTNNDSSSQVFSTIAIADGPNRRKETFRELLFYIHVNGQWNIVRVSKSLEATDDMMESIVTITLITILLILAISFLINRLVLKKLWQPFYGTLETMRNYKLGRNKRLQFPATSIDEFAIMNDTLSAATAKADEDYQYLKEFTENASHELQTPLAIIRSKLDVLIQDEHLSEPQSRAVQGAYEAIQRLARLNQGLLLLTKIENGQYAQTTAINLSQKINEKIAQFNELVASKNILMTASLNESVCININPELLDILLNNLFSNAIKYNLQGGHINIIASEGFFEINNTASTTALDESRLFRRFAKSGQASEGIGLGLAIVRELAAFSGFDTRYIYEDKLHHFIVAENNHSSVRTNHHA